MLVLSRRETERVRLGDNIVLTIVRVSGDKVRLGIEAPANVLVLRDELQPHGDAATEGNGESQEVPQRKAA
jgi:carbon storage regulator